MGECPWGPGLGVSSQWPLGTKFPSGEGEAAEGTIEERSSQGNQAVSISLGGLSFHPGFCGYQVGERGFLMASSKTAGIDFPFPKMAYSHGK